MRTGGYDADGVSPLVSVMYKPRPRMTVYATAGSSLQQGDIAPGTAVNAGQALERRIARSSRRSNCGDGHVCSLVLDEEWASSLGAESREIEGANASGTTPVVFIHGLWLLPSSWANWADFFKQAGYAPDAGLARRSGNSEVARANPNVLAKKTLKQVAHHTAEVIGKLEKKPAVMGHSTGGLSPRCSPAVGSLPATVAMSRAVSRRSAAALSALKAGGPFLLNPRYRGRAITLGSTSSSTAGRTP